MPLPASSGPSSATTWTLRLVQSEIARLFFYTYLSQELNVEVSVFATKPIILHGVKLKESAFRDFDLPLR